MTDSTMTQTRPHAGVLAYLVVAGVVILLMMLLGLLMRLDQATALDLGLAGFYRVMTAHGAGMVGIMGLGGAAVMWHFLSRHVQLSGAILFINLLLFLVGAVMVLGSIFIGGYAGAWTFLYPLPAQAAGAWSPHAAAVFTGGLLAIGTGFLLLHLDTARAIIQRYGSLPRALGWPQLFGGDTSEPPPAAVVASTMVLIVNILGITAGAAILVMTLVNLYVPAFDIDPLLAKNLIYFFGHVFINATIYMAVIGVYEILPVYTKRPWKVNRVFLAAWTASTIMVIIVYPHHLLMDFAMPTWMLAMGQIISYTSGLPVLVVTAYGALLLVHRSGIQWNTAASLLFLSVFGWAAGVIPAIIDAVIPVNTVMHNTLWVPGHFHFYLLLGVAAMVLGFMYHLRAANHHDGLLDRAAFWAYMIGALGFVMSFLYSGNQSVPRRYADHAPQWVAYDQIASAFAILVVAAMAVFLLRFFAGLRPRTAR